MSCGPGVRMMNQDLPAGKCVTHRDVAPVLLHGRTLIRILRKDVSIRVLHVGTVDVDVHGHGKSL